MAIEMKAAPGVSDTAEGLAATPWLESALASSQSTEPAPTSVYRYYDRNGILVYVGITSRGIQRNREHNTDKAWWPHVTRQEVEHYPTRLAASDREKSLVRQYRPPFNTHYNPDHIATRNAYLAFVESQSAGETPTEMVKRLRNEIPLYQQDRGDRHTWLRTGIGHWPIASILLRNPDAKVSTCGDKSKSLVAEIEIAFPFAYIRLSRNAIGPILRAHMAVRWTGGNTGGLELRSMMIWVEPTEKDLLMKARKLALYGARHRKGERP